MSALQINNSPGHLCRAEPLREEQARAGLVRELLRVQLETVTQSLQPQASHNVLAESLQPIK